MPPDQVFSKWDSPASSPSRRRPADGAEGVTDSTKTPPTNSSTSELNSVTSSAQSRLSVVPDGSSSVKCQTPNTESFSFDHATGYRFDPSTGLHYDANSGFFINHDLEIVLRWDPLSKTYQRAGDQAVVAKPVVFRAVESSISAESGKSKKRSLDKCKPKRERASLSNVERQGVNLVPYESSPERPKNKRCKRAASRNKSESPIGQRKGSSRDGRVGRSPGTSERSRGRCKKRRSVSRGESPSRTNIRRAERTRSRSRVSGRSTNRESRSSSSSDRDSICHRSVRGRSSSRESRRSTSRGARSQSRNGSKHTNREYRRRHSRERKRSRSSRNRRSNHSDSDWIDRIVRSLGSKTSRKANKPNGLEPPPKEKCLYPRDDTPSNPQPARETPAGVERMKKSGHDSSFTSHKSTVISEEKLVPKIVVSDDDEQIPDKNPKDIIIDNGDMLGHLFTSDVKSVTNILLVAPVPLQNRSKSASDALKNQIVIGNPPDILKVCMNHESTSGLPCSFMVIPFKSANSAKRWYDSLSGTIVLTGEDGSRMKAYLHFLKKGNWNCRHCKSFNFFMQSICSKCYVAKENGFSPISISQGPTNYVGIAKLNNCFSTVKKVTDSLPPLDDFKILNIEMITEPGGFTLGLCVFEVESKEEGSKLHEFFLQRKRNAVYVVMNETPKTPDELYLDRLFDKPCVTNILFVALIPISNIPDMNLELTLMELYLTMLLKEDDVNYEKITLHVDKNCGAPYSHALITFADAETAARWLKSRSRTFNKVSPSNQRSKVSLHFSEDNWKCESCQNLNFSCRSLCWHCFKHKIQNMIGPISQPLVSVTTKWVATPVSSNWSETDDYIIVYFRELLKEFVFKGMEVLRDSKYQSLPLACVFEMHDKVESLRLKEYLIKEGTAAVFVVMRKEFNERSSDDTSDAPDLVIVDEPPPPCIDLTSDDNPTEDAVTTNSLNVNIPLVRRAKSSQNFGKPGPRRQITNYKQLIGGREQLEHQPPGPQSQVVETIDSWRQSVPPQPPIPQQLPAQTFGSWGQSGPGPSLPPQQPPVLMNVFRPPVCQPSPLCTSYTLPFKNNKDIICMGPVFHPGKNASIFYMKLFLNGDCKSVRFCEANSYGVHCNYCLLYFKSPISADEWYNERQGFIRIKYQKFPGIDIANFEPHEAYLHILGENWFCDCSIENSPVRSVCFRCYKQRGELEAPLEKSSIPTKYIGLTLYKWYPASVLAENISARRCRSFKVQKIRYFSDPMINRDHFGLYVFEIGTLTPARHLRDFALSLRIVKSSDYVVLKDPDAGAIIELDFSFNPVASLRIVNDDRDFDSISGNMMEKVFIMGKSRKVIRPDYETFLWTSIYEYRLNNPPTNVVMISSCPGDRELPLQARTQIQDSFEKAGVRCNTLLYCSKGDVGSPFTYCLVFFESLDLAKIWFDKCNGIFEFNIPHPDENITLTFTNCFSQKTKSQWDKTYFIRSKLHYSYPNWLCSCGCPNFPLRSICHNCFGNKLDGSVRLNSYVSCPFPSNFVGIKLGKYFSNLDPSHLMGAHKSGYKIIDTKICLDKSLPRDPCGVVIFRLSSNPEAIRFHAFLARSKKPVNFFQLPELMEVLDNSLGTTFLVCEPLLESNWFTYQSENWDTFFSNEVCTNVIAIYHQLLVGTFPTLDFPVELYGGKVQRFKRGGGFTSTFWLIFFPTPQAAQEWYAVNRGVLSNQDNHLNLYFTEGIWTCPQCSSANFPARVLCFKCYEHIGGGYSPLRLSASPTRWVGVPKQSNHTVAFECLGNTDINFRSIRIITDPIVRLDGPSVLVFEVSTATVGIALRDILEEKKIGSSFFVVFEGSKSHFAVGSECSLSEVSVQQTMAVTRRNPRDSTSVPLIDNIVGSNYASEKTFRPNLTTVAIASTSGVEPAKGPLDVPVIIEEEVIIMSDDEIDGETTQQNQSCAAIPERASSNLRPISSTDEFREVVCPDYEALLWTSVYEYHLNNPPTNVVMISLCPGDRELPLQATIQIQDSVEKAGINCYRISYSFKGDVGSPFSYCLLYFDSQDLAKTWFKNCNGIFEFKIPPLHDENITLTFSNCFSQKSGSESDNPHYIRSKLHFSYPNWLCSCGCFNFPLRSICHNCFGNKLGKPETLDGYVTCSHPGNFVGIRLSKYFSNLDPRHLVAVRKFQHGVSDARVCLDTSLPRDPCGIVIFELKSHLEAQHFYEYLTNLPKAGNRDACLSGLMTILKNSLGITYLMCKPPLESNWLAYQSENWHSYFNNEIPTNFIAIYRHQLLNSNPPVSDSILRPYNGKIERFKRVGGFTPSFFLVSFPTPEYARSWYFHSNGMWKIKNETLTLYFTQGFWACRQCNATNFPARVLCNRCYRHKTDGYSPLRLSASPTKWVGVTCPINSRQESLLASTLKEMRFKLRSVRIVTDPIVRLDGPSILVLEVSTLKVGVELRNFFIALHFDVDFFHVIENSESVCSLPEIPDQLAVVTAGNPEMSTPVSEFDKIEPILGSKDTPDDICRQNAAIKSVASKRCSKPSETPLDGSVNVIEESFPLSKGSVIAGQNNKIDVNSACQDERKKRKRHRRQSALESACFAALIFNKVANEVALPPAKNAEGPRNPSQKASAQDSISDGVFENKETKDYIIPEPFKISHPKTFGGLSSSDLSGAKNSEELVIPRDTLSLESNETPDETRWQNAANHVIASTSHLKPPKNPIDGSVDAIEKPFSLIEGSVITEHDNKTDSDSAFQNKKKSISDAVEENKEPKASVIPEQSEISHSDLLGGEIADDLVIQKDTRSSGTSDTSLGKNIVSSPTKPFKNSPPTSSESPVPSPQKTINVLPTAMDLSDAAICPNYETIIWKYLYEYRLNIPPTNIVMISTYSGDHELPHEARSRIQRSLQEAGVIHKSILHYRKGVDGSPFCYCQVTFDSVDFAKVWFNECKGTFKLGFPNDQKMSLNLAQLNYSLPNWRCSCGATNFYMRSRCHYCASVKSEIWDSFFEKGTIASSIVFQMGSIKSRKFQEELSPEEYGGIFKCFLKAPSGFMADFCMVKFANEQNAKRWYDANGGKLKFPVLKHQPTLYFTEDLWKCQYCNSSNFPKRILCYRCYRHKTNGFSPVQISPTQATKWIGINRPHDHKKAIDIVKKNELVLRSVQIITDPNVRQDGTYLLLFEVSTSKKGMELYNLFAKEIAVSKLGFFKVDESSVRSIRGRANVDCATIIEEGTQKRNPVPDSEREVKVEEGGDNVANKLDSAVETASLNTPTHPHARTPSVCAQREIKLAQDQLIVKTSPIQQTGIKSDKGEKLDIKTDPLLDEASIKVEQTTEITG